MALIESAVCTNKNSSGKKRSWKAFLEYTTTTKAASKEVVVTKAGLFGTTPADGAGMEIRNRNITLKVNNTTLAKTFNGSSFYFNAYPNKTSNYRNEIPNVGSGGANNYDWASAGETVFSFPRKASAYTVTIDFTVAVTSGAWTGTRSVEQQVITVPASANAYVVPTDHKYGEQTRDEEHIGLSVTATGVTWTSTALASLDEGEDFEIDFSNFVYTKDGEKITESHTAEFIKGTSSSGEFSVYTDGYKWHIFTYWYDGTNRFTFANAGYEEPVSADDLSTWGEVIWHNAGGSVNEAARRDVLYNLTNGVTYTFDGNGWTVSVDDDFRDELETVTLFNEVNFEPVISIADAFHDCTHLETVNIPTSVQDTSGAFDGCVALTGYFLIPDTVTEFDGMFEGTVMPIFVEGAHASEIAAEMPNVRQPKWTVTHTVEGEAPDIMSNGKARINVYAYNYVDQEEQLISSPSGWDVELGDTSWTVTIELGKNYVLDSDATTTKAKVRIAYSNISTTETEQQSAFYHTSRNINFHTGLANNVFVSGTNVVDYASRVWYSEVNNPLNFPDDRYMEVGSNDKEIMGLVKVDEYLGVIKQGATTETSIYLAFATSFEDDTAFAIKQSIGGVGALAKYAFNILNGETLFLSAQGIMAIETLEDDQHRVKDRGYFLNGKMLSEPNLEDAYSFVWNGWYLLAVNDHIYVLDGNQRNSWGNDRTNLVYEGYYLEGVTVNNFVSCKGELWFSTDSELCRFKGRDEEDAYLDNGDPVFARWSTVLDDDGAINFYKTMRKKGNVISLLPDVSEFTKVYVRKDTNDPVEIKRTFSEYANIPNEMFVNKKFKKYKRLQFIIENDAAESFGIDSITKQYTMGNYAKK